MLMLSSPCVVEWVSYAVTWLHIVASQMQNNPSTVSPAISRIDFS